MAWDHIKKQTELALEAINRPYPHRPLKVVPHDPTKNPYLVTKIKDWITTEIFLINRTPEEMERLLGFDSRPGHEYLPLGIDVFEFTRSILAGDFALGGPTPTCRAANRGMERIALAVPAQCRLIREVPCRLVKTVRRGLPYV